MSDTYKKIDISQAHTFNVSDEFAKELVDYRINLKKPLTQNAFNRALSQAVKASVECGITPDKAIEITIDCGWQGVVSSYIKNELRKRGEYETGRGSVIRNTARQTRSDRADNQLITVITGGKDNAR